MQVPSGAKTPNVKKSEKAALPVKRLEVEKLKETALRVKKPEEKELQAEKPEINAPEESQIRRALETYVLNAGLNRDRKKFR